MSTAALLLPNQLFAEHPGVAARPDAVVLFEDPLFFGDAFYPATMHKQKLWLHRASMTRYRDGLVAKGFDAAIWPFERQPGACLRLLQSLRDRGISNIIMVDPVDLIAEKRLRAAAGRTDITLDFQPSPGFLNTRGRQSGLVCRSQTLVHGRVLQKATRPLECVDGRRSTGGGTMEL